MHSLRRRPTTRPSSFTRNWRTCSPARTRVPSQNRPLSRPRTSRSPSPSDADRPAYRGRRRWGMADQVLTEVSAVVAAERVDALRAAYRQLANEPLPEGLLRSELLRGLDGRWRIQTLWRDRAAIAALRARSE